MGGGRRKYRKEKLVNPKARDLVKRAEQIYEAKASKDEVVGLLLEALKEITDAGPTTKVLGNETHPKMT